MTQLAVCDEPQTDTTELETANVPHDTYLPDPDRKDFYRGLLLGLQALADLRNRVEIVLSPYHFKELMQMSTDYTALEDRRRADTTEKQNLHRRIADLENALNARSGAKNVQC